MFKKLVNFIHVQTFVVGEGKYETSKSQPIPNAICLGREKIPRPSFIGQVPTPFSNPRLVQANDCVHVCMKYTTAYVFNLYNVVRPIISMHVSRCNPSLLLMRVFCERVTLNFYRADPEFFLVKQFIYQKFCMSKNL